jgi:hypothetical protein
MSERARMRSVDRCVPSIRRTLMGLKVIGIDPHKRSHTAVVLDQDEEIAAQLRVAADRRQTDRLLAWANEWPTRISGRSRTSTGSAACSPSNWCWPGNRSLTSPPRPRTAPASSRASQAARPTPTMPARSPSRPPTRAGCEPSNSRNSRKRSGLSSTAAGTWSASVIAPSAGCTRCSPR